MSNKLQKTSRSVAAPVHHVTGAQITTTYSGPIPSASEMQKYEDACPGLPSQIMAMTEGQLTHRQEIERIVIKSSSRNSTLGVVFAFVLAMTTLIIAGICIYLDKDILGSIIGGVGLSCIVGTFIYGTRSNRAERENKISRNN